MLFMAHLTKDMQTEQLLCWSGMTDTELNEEEEWVNFCANLFGRLLRTAPKNYHACDILRLIFAFLLRNLLLFRFH